MECVAASSVARRAGVVSEIDLSDGFRSQESLQSVDQALSRVSEARAQLGAQQWRLGLHQRNQGSVIESLSWSSAMRTAQDVAEGIRVLGSAQSGLQSAAEVQAKRISLYGDTLLSILDTRIR